MTAFDQAFALLKMPIDWDTVTEPTFSHSIGGTEGEASAQWIHPKTGERYNIRMDKWLRNTLLPTLADMERNTEASTYMRESGAMAVTKPMSDEKAETLAEAMRAVSEYMAEKGECQA